VRFGGFCIMLPDALRTRTAGRAAAVIGLRPTDFRWRPADFVLVDDAPVTSTACLHVTPETVEELGAEQMVVFPVDVPRYVPPGAQQTTASASTDEETLLAEPERSRFTARLDMRQLVRRGQPLDLWFDAAQLYLFDPETGVAL